MMNRRFWFRTRRFKIEPGEDEATNPGCYGKQLSEWLVEALRERGRKVEGIIPEDWGWCVMCSRDRFLLWVGCGCVADSDLANDSGPPSEEGLTWMCFVEAERLPGLTWFRRIDGAAVQALVDDVRSVIESAGDIELVEEP
jgi:hypothetical protein